MMKEFWRVGFSGERTQYLPVKTQSTKRQKLISAGLLETGKIPESESGSELLIQET